MNDWRIKIIDKGYKISREIYIYRYTHDGKVQLLNGSIYDLNTIPDKPDLELEPEQLQALADELASIGYKPLKGFIEGKLEATEKHLEDMRKLMKIK